MMTDHKIFMTRCLELAKHGLGLVYPNPMVGCVIVHNGEIIGEGWHQKAGSHHAEVNAINAVKRTDLLPESTLYVNLEPCSHYGRTPPCADRIIKSGIKNVVIGSLDSNEKVSGKGVRRLRENGIDVITPVLEDACVKLNRRFFTFHEKKRPYVILKWAQSKDGYIFPDKGTIDEGAPFWISNSYSLQKVHQWRAEEAAILVGKNTVLQDNPKLNIRHFTGNSILRIVIDRKLEIPQHMNFFDNSVETLIYNQVKEGKQGRLNYVKCDFDKDIVAQILNHLYSQEVQSLIVEGGSFTLNAFLEADLWDEARVVEGQAYFGSGIKAPFLEEEVKGVDHLLHDNVFLYKRI